MPKDKGIRIDPERGVNPRMTTCAQCGADTNELALLGTNDHELRCTHCDAAVLGTAKQVKCPRCHQHALKHVRRLGEFEKVSLGMCDPCKEKHRQSEDIARQGGILWRCVDCHSAGAIRAGHPLAEMVRKKTGIAPPHPAGINFDKDTCPVCGPHRVRPEETDPHDVGAIQG